MRFINSKVHGVLDYLVSVLLIASPWLLGYYRGGIESWFPVIVGTMSILYSICTRYEMGLVNYETGISFRAHLWMDIISGVVLAASPWIIGFNDQVYLPHVCIGILEIIVVSFTDPFTSEEHRKEDNKRIITNAFLRGNRGHA